MNLEAGWLNRQLDHAAAEFEKWPSWMKEAARRDEQERQRERADSSLTSSQKKDDAPAAD
jgi:hypothetical protein